MGTGGLPYGPRRETRNPAKFTGDEADRLVASVRLDAGTMNDPTESQRRPAHALGIVTTGRFTPNGKLARYTDAPHLTVEQTEATTRFSSFKKRDWGDKDLRGMATRLVRTDGWEHDLVALSAPRFISRRVEDFHHISRNLGAVTVISMLATRRVTATALWTLLDHQRIRSLRSLAATEFFGVHTFWFEGDEMLPFRYRWRPVDTTRKPNPTPLDADLRARVAAGPVEFDLVCQVLPTRGPERRLHDAMRSWPKGAGETVEGGRLTLDTAQPATHPAEADWVFNPVHLPPGVVPSEDEILLARGAAYEASHVERAAASGRL